MKEKSITAIVLSAGKGVRMRSSLPKGLHPVAGQPLLARILGTLKQVPFINDIRVVINEDSVHLMKPVADAFKARVCFQDPKKTGTAGAVCSAKLDSIEDNVLILNGDHPFISLSDLNGMIESFYKKEADLCVGTFEAQNPTDYGRIIRHRQKIVAIAEKDSLTHESKKINEINTGIYVVKSHWLSLCLPQIGNDNLKKEYGLTDMLSLSSKENKKIISFSVSADTAFGINSQMELSFATKKSFTKKLNDLMKQGVIIIDPLNTYIEEAVQVGEGSVIYPGVYLKGRTSIGSFCAIEPHSFILNSVIHKLVLIRAGSYLESVEVGSESVIGPYARLRPKTKVGEGCRVGNFVEMKNTSLGARSKASHLSYLGDAQIGEDVNIGCGTVTCNLNKDGKKYQTKIGDHVFVGSGTQLVAPVELEDQSGTGAGSVITKNVPSKSLGLERSEQKNLENYFVEKKNENLK